MNTHATILLVEDDVVDVMTVRRAVRELHLANPLRVTHNGEEALESLRTPDQPLPGLILLDLNMPRMNGLEFLQAVKADPRLRRVPVVMLTTSRQDSDRLQSYDLGVAGYILKPVEYPRFVEILRCIEQYWDKCEPAP